MYNINLTLHKPRRLSCVWLRTGNLRTPLTCVWMESNLQHNDIAATSSNEDSGRLPLCA